MPKLLLPNLLFEEELGGRDSLVSTAARRVVAELSPVMGLLSTGSASEDIVVIPHNCVPDELPPVLEHVRFVSEQTARGQSLAYTEFCPWGWSHAAIEFGRRSGLDFDFPDSKVVQHINRREFLAPFDDSVDGTSHPEPFGALCRSVDDVNAALLRFEHNGHAGWVIKSSLSQAARSRLNGRSLPHSTAELGWLKTRFDAGQSVYAEPWVERLAECGLQFTVPPLSSDDASVQFEGATELLTDEAGRYLGSVLPMTTAASETEWWHPAIERCTNIADQARQRGYFGAIGFDCMAFLNPVDQRVCLRRCHDINGRITMGRIALSLRHYLRNDEIGIWCHCTLKPPQTFENLLSGSAHSNIRILPTSPGRVGGLSVKHQTALLIANDRTRLISAFRLLFGQQTRTPLIQYTGKRTTAATRGRSPGR